MAPHSLESILQPPLWPSSLSSFVTWCLMWDPKNRPTSAQALNHEYFADAVDPLRPKSSTSRLLGKKQSDKSFRSPTREPIDSPPLTSKPSWFRRSLIGRSESPAATMEGDQSAKPPVVSYSTVPEPQTAKTKQPANSKRATWANGAPMAILPSIRPVSPLSNAVTAQANSTLAYGGENSTAYADSGKPGKKIGRQLSLNSHGNHYPDTNRQEAERALNGGGGSTTPQKESFFSHLRKRARRLSGRNQGNVPNDDIEANAGCMPWSNRSSLALDSANSGEPKQNTDLSELDNALQNVKYSLDTSSLGNVPVQLTSPGDGSSKRQSMPHGSVRSMGDSPASTNGNTGPISSRTRRAMQMSTHPVHRYETPEEEDELLDEVLHSASKAARRLAQNPSPSDESSNPGRQPVGNNSRTLPSPYPTPSPSAKCDGISFGQNDTPCRRAPFIDGKTGHASVTRQWPTPPYEEGEWTGTDYFSAGATYR
jgi:meiosis induction protein kinase IME2/SME1